MGRANVVPVSIAEEAKDPSRVVPMAITAASTFTYVAGFAFNIILAFCMGDPRSLLQSPTDQPVSGFEVSNASASC
jgi:amino acid transporter